MQTTRINTTAKVSGNTMINIKSRMNLSVNKPHHKMTLDMNLFNVFFFLFLFRNLNNTKQSRLPMHGKNERKRRG